jgi:hypothetical protein
LWGAALAIKYPACICNYALARSASVVRFFLLDGVDVLLKSFEFLH